MFDSGREPRGTTSKKRHVKSNESAEGRYSLKIRNQVLYQLS